jgi:hypothetical protein
MINGELRRFRGSIAYVSGDNPGIHLMGGFKEGCQAHRKCRHCLGIDEQIKNMVSDGVNYILLPVLH